MFVRVVKQVEEENENDLQLAMDECGYFLGKRTLYDLLNGKQFVRLDFLNKSDMERGEIK